MNKILIIDDEQDICTLLKKFFSKNGFEVFTAASGKSGIKLIEEKGVDLVICDFRLPDYTGLEILQKIKIVDPSIQVIIITGYSDVRIAVEALKKGAFDYVTKPLHPDEILHSVEGALKSEKKPAAANLSKAKKSRKNKQYVSGTSQQSQTVLKHVNLIAPTDMSVIILGETGTGKEYAARAIHQKSKRSAGPFVAVDCGALPNELAASELFGHVKGAFTGALNDKKGCFELASGGTLFLDEVGNLSYENQIKLLRVLQERVVKKVGGSKDISVDVRIIAATNENLKHAVESGDIREDLYHRMNEFNIQLSPLRERREDIILFARHFLKLANERLDREVKEFDEEVIEKLKAYHWHGNLRELGNVVKRAVLLSKSKTITVDLLPKEITDPEVQHEEEQEINISLGLTLKQVAEMAEKKAILQALKQTNNNKSKTAAMLDVDRKTLYNKLKSYNIDG
ncbi:MAG: sigma-54 dependent transcriptional regulator [Ekhidna sp.]